MDAADYAAKDSELITGAAIHRIRQKAKIDTDYPRCCFCFDEIEKGGFCDKICQKKFELKQRG